MSKRKDLTGKTFGYWTVLSRMESPRYTWWCRCMCGVERAVFGGHLVSGKSRSCGCRKYENARAAYVYKHGVPSALINTKFIVLASASCAQDLGRYFAKNHDMSIWHVSDVQKKILLEGVRNPAYSFVWVYVLGNAYIIEADGAEWRLEHPLPTSGAAILCAVRKASCNRRAR